MAGNEPDADVEALVAAGRHADAAAAAVAAGNHARAGELFELVWEFGGAARAWKAAGDLGRALGNAIEARDEPLVAELLATLTADDDGARTALDVLVRRKRHADAAPLAERLGNVEQAIDLYQRAHKDLDAARLLEAAGRDRESGRVLEKVLDLADGADQAEAHLRLGRILARRGSHEAAARHLQDASKHPAIRPQALHQLVLALAAMGLRDAARDTLLELRRLDATTSPDLDTFLRSVRDAEPRKAHPDREIVGGRYRLDKLLGAGSAGRVFRAIDEVTNKVVAIKMLFAASARGSTSYERFLREARIASALRHPAIVEVYDFSVDQGFLVMEYLAGGSLAARIGAGEKFTGPQVRRMALELLGGLELAHHRGVVHRDVKPANVFFDSRGAAKLGDFGVAHLIDLGQTQTGGLIGTLAYMSPEQITGAPITIAADLYSLGVTVFEALTGRLPFLGPDYVAQHLGEDPPSPRSITATLAPAWDPLIARMLKKSPTERHAAIGDLRGELEQLAHDGAAVVLPRARRDSRPPSIAGLAALDDDEPAPQERPRYDFETPLGSTPISTLTRALDTVLGRSVVIEKFLDDPAAESAIARVRLLARASSPFIQRALSYDRERRTAVLEAPSGAPLGELAGRFSPIEAVRMLKRLARAAGALRELGGAHGAIGPSTVVVDDNGVPTLLASGLGPVKSDATARGDVDAIVAAVAGILSAQPTLEGLLAALGVTITHPAPNDGDDLYALADKAEIAMIRARPVSG